MLTFILIALIEHIIYAMFCFWGLKCLIRLVGPLFYFESFKPDLNRLRDFSFFLFFLGATSFGYHFYRTLFGIKPLLLEASAPYLLITGLLGLGGLTLLRICSRGYIFTPILDLSRVLFSLNQMAIFMVATTGFFSVYLLFWRPVKDFFLLLTYL